MIMDGVFPVDIGPQYEGEVIRKADLYVEFGGPNVNSQIRAAYHEKTGPG